MSIATDLRTFLLADATLTTLISTRLYPGVLPQNPILPAMTYQWISGPRFHSTDGPSGLSNPRIQFDCWASTYLEAETVFTALRKRLDGYQGMAGSSRIQAAFLESERDEYEDEARLYRRSADFFVWYEEAVS